MGATGEHGVGFEFVDQAERSRRIARPACRQIEAERIAERVTDGVQLAGKAASRAAKRQISRVFLAPAAQA